MKQCFRVTAFAAAMIAAAMTSRAEAPVMRSTVATTPHFVFHSDFTTNLHDALLEAGRARSQGKPELFRSGEDAECLAGLAPSARTAWDLAVEYYAEVISPRRWSDRQQALIRLDLARLSELPRERDRRYVGIARGFMAAAGPAYESCRWKTQDARNRGWIASLVAQLELHETTLAAELARLYGKPLGGLPIRVDVVETVNWSGATTWLLDPDGGHIVISNVERGPVSLEYLFHEASHTLMRPEDPIHVSLREAAARLDAALPPDLWHAVLFYTTGDAVRRVLAAADEPAYTPLLFAGDIFGRHHDALRTGWTAYLAGERGLPEAAEALIGAYGAGSDPPD